MLLSLLLGTEKADARACALVSTSMHPVYTGCPCRISDTQRSFSQVSRFGQGMKWFLLAVTSILGHHTVCLHVWCSVTEINPPNEGHSLYSSKGNEIILRDLQRTVASKEPEVMVARGLPFQQAFGSWPRDESVSNGCKCVCRGS